jgi:hypothetical protein
MLWQFGELGYDNSIFDCFNGTFDESCKLDPKPIRWDFLEDEDRTRLRDVTKALIHLKLNYPTFTTDDYTFYNGNFFLKSLTLEHEEMDAVVMANFRVIDVQMNPKFSKTGTWHEYFTGDSIVVEDTQAKLDFYPGEYRIYLTEPLTPPTGVFTSTAELNSNTDVRVYPNPIGFSNQVEIQLPDESPIDKIRLMDLNGRSYFVQATQSGLILSLDLPSSLNDGMYIIEVLRGHQRFIAKVVK